MLNVEFKNENFRWRFNLLDASGTPVSVENVQALGVVFYGEFEDDVWLRCKWPEETDKHPIIKADDDSAFFIEVDPEDTMRAPEGVIIVEATYRIADDRFLSGYKQTIEKGKFMRIVNSRQ